MNVYLKPNNQYYTQSYPRLSQQAIEPPLIKCSPKYTILTD